MHRLRRLPRLMSGALALGAGALAYPRSSACTPPAPPSSPDDVRLGVPGLVGDTPLVELTSLSALTGRRILAKAEFMSSGGSVKDRAAWAIIQAHERAGRLVPRGQPRPPNAGSIIVEATGGNTGVSLALLAAARGYRCILTMPEQVSEEKRDAMRALGAEVIVCPAAPFTSPAHFFQMASRIAAETPGAVLGGQFESTVNAEAHLTGTGPEIWAQTRGVVDAFVCAAGTGGTISGVSRFLRSVNPAVRLLLVDPPGSSLAAFVERGVLAPSPGVSYLEGIGIGRLTANMASAPPLDGVLRVSDEEATRMAYFLMRREGLCVGPSAALNVVGAVKAARALPPGSTVVTILCDGGARYQSKLLSREWLRAQGLEGAIDADYEGGDALRFVGD